MAHADLCYTIDEYDRITSVTGPWDDFALHNSKGSHAERLNSALIIGKPFLEFIHDDATRMLMNSIVSSVRILGKNRQVDYRCDSSTEKRYMRMRVSIAGDRAVKLCHEMLRSEPLSPPFATRSVTAEQTHYHRCSQCNRIELDQVWLEPDSELLRDMPQPCPVYHSICPLCAELLY
jgi:hypothetical protein